MGPLPSVPRMRVTATLLELRALMQAGVQEAALFTAHMLRGGLHELERKLHVSLCGRAWAEAGAAGGGGSIVWEWVELLSWLACPGGELYVRGLILEFGAWKWCVKRGRCAGLSVCARCLYRQDDCARTAHPHGAPAPTTV